MEYNKGLDFWKKEHKECNCGSYAFNLNEWYSPGVICGADDENGLMDCLDYWYGEGYRREELADELAKFYLERIEDDFKDSIKIVTEMPELYRPNAEVIAFRAAAYAGEDYENFDYDFHFKVFRDGKWLEKKGSQPIKFTSIEDWSGSICYNSQTFYIIHSLENLTFN